MRGIGGALFVEALMVIGGAGVGVDAALRTQPDDLFIAVCILVAAATGAMLGLFTVPLRVARPGLLWLWLSGGWIVGAALYVALVPQVEWRECLLAAGIASVPGFLIGVRLALSAA